MIIKRLETKVEIMGKPAVHCQAWKEAYKRGDDMEYVEIDGHKLHLLRAGDEKTPKLVFMSGSGTISPVYHFTFCLIFRVGAA